MLRAMNKLLDPVRRRIRLILTRAIVNLVNDAKGLQLVQVTALADETLDGVERFQDYGFTSVPHPGAETLAGAVGGNRSHTVIIRADDRRYRVKGLQGGEVCIYTDEGDRIHLKRGRLVEVQTQTLLVKAGTKVRFETPLLENTGEIRDKTDSGGTTMSHMRDVYDAHIHPGCTTGSTGTPSQEMD